MMIELDLPFPPSTNSIWRTGRGRTYLSSTYKRWKQDADATIMARTAGKPWHKPIEGPFSIAVLLNEKMGWKRKDGDNLVKAILDWLQSREVVANDKWCRKGTWEWVRPDRAPDGCRVVLMPL
jgi:crossover junction endodeoxyribonuclease RusA